MSGATIPREPPERTVRSRCRRSRLSAAGSRSDPPWDGVALVPQTNVKRALRLHRQSALTLSHCKGSVEVVDALQKKKVPVDFASWAALLGILLSSLCLLSWLLLLCRSGFD